MDCFICNGSCSFYFEKRFEPPYDEHLGLVSYYRCSNCGFVASRTHAALDSQSWEKINYLFHEFVESPRNKQTINQPPYIQQALLLTVLSQNRLLSLESVIDWAGGYGTLAACAGKYFQEKIPVFEKYMQSPTIRYVAQEDLERYQTVISSAVFEHVTKRAYLDEIDRCVADDGCLVLHTVVCEDIPRDPTWFYFLPVHCAFHTNRSMEILMHQWGYCSSVYCPSAKSWVLFKDRNTQMSRDAVSLINSELQSTYLYYKDGFMDYWK